MMLSSEMTIESGNIEEMSSSYPQCIIYGLVDPRTMLVRYVGKSASGIKRPQRHARELGHNQHRDRWIAQLKAAGLKYEIVVLQVSSAADLVADEIWWIAYGRASEWMLTNATNGGEGGATFTGRTHSAEARAKISASRKGTKASAETRAKLSAARIGRKFSAEHRANLSAANKGKKPSLQAVALAKAANTGRKKSIDTILKMKEIGRSSSNLEHLSRVSAGNIGRSHSPQAIENMKAAWNQRRVSKDSES